MAAAFLAASRGGDLSALGLTIRARQIAAIEVIADPDRLRRLELAVLPD